MKYLLLLFTLPFLSATECGKKKGKPAAGDPVAEQPVRTDSVPVCVRKILDSAAKDIPPVLPQQVDEYEYNGDKVYLFTMPCCDFFNPVYDEQCKQLCAPSGGFSGRGDGKCPDFGEKAKKLRLVWKKEAP